MRTTIHTSQTHIIGSGKGGDVGSINRAEDTTRPETNEEKREGAKTGTGTHRTGAEKKQERQSQRAGTSQT